MYVKPWKRRILVNRFQYRLLVGNFLYLIDKTIFGARRIDNLILSIST